MALDLQVFYFLNNLAGDDSAFYDIIFVFLAKYLPYVAVLAFLAVIFLPKPAKKKLRLLVIASASATVSRLGITELIRYFFYRPRPFMVHEVHQLIQDSHSSFPSGHAAFFFALSTAIYLYDKNLGFFFYIISAVIVISRVICGVHYPSDIIAGAIIGIITGYLITKISKHHNLTFLK